MGSGLDNLNIGKRVLSDARGLAAWATIELYDVYEKDMAEIRIRTDVKL